ncbi:helix-turn-helix transcriptional regulator [Candidatus Kaiserbacteria bacterium]|nr:helix-turn-helix transcriptional regulator [Candidatus Kaiserbacteria bacterium]
MMLRTVQQRKTLCRSCGVAKVADLLGDSCSLLVLRDILERPRRFGELQTSLAGISTRTLTNKLKILEREGLIVHKKTPPSPPALYRLTKKGAALQDVVEAMRAYGKKYL